MTFNGAKPIRTERDNETKIILVDGASGSSATKSLSILPEGEEYQAGVNDHGVPSMWKDSEGDSVIPQLLAGNRVPVALVDADGDQFDVNSDGSLNVVPVEDPNIEFVLDYHSTAAAVPNAVNTHDYVITDTKKFVGKTVLVGSRGSSFVRVGLWDGTDFTPKFAFFQNPRENSPVDISAMQAIGNATLAVRIEITNLDGGNTTVHSTLQGTEK
jgi:hypothetical protein